MANARNNAIHAVFRASQFAVAWWGKGSRSERGRSMKNMRWSVSGILATLVLAIPSVHAAGSIVGPIKAKSYSKLTFGPNGILFLGDSLGARIYALDLDDRTPLATVKPLQISDLESKLAGMLGIDAGDVLIHDMAVNPISKNTYFTVSRGRRNFAMDFQLPNDIASASALLRITPSGEIQEVRLDNVKHSFVEVSNPINEKAEEAWKKSKQRVDVISDMAFADGKLYVAGLSNEEFSSTMRIYPFPFDGPGTASSLEIYHGSHGKYETNSPIRAFLPLKIKGREHLLASYLCTPVVLFETDQLKDKKHVKGTTIGELGSGNYPLDMVAFRWRGKDWIMVVNSTRGVLLISIEDLEKPLPSITTKIEDTAGVPIQYLRNRGVLQVENYGEKNLLLLSRDLLSGQVNLATLSTDVS